MQIFTHFTQRMNSMATLRQFLYGSVALVGAPDKSLRGSLVQRTTATCAIVVLSAVVVAFPGAAQAATPAGLDLGTDNNYAFIDLGATTLGWNSGPIAGNVLFGLGLHANLSGGNNGGLTNGGVLFHDSSAIISGSLQNPVTETLVPTTTTQDAATIAQNVSSFASSLAATQTFTTINNTTTIAGNGGLNVIDVANIQNAKLTLSGTANDFFLFNVSNAISTNQPMTLSGGVSPSNILFNLTGTGTVAVFQTSGGDVSFGTYLATNGGGFQFSNLNLTGRLINIGGNVQFVSGSMIPAVPEPTTLVFLVAGLLVLGATRWCKVSNWSTASFLAHLSVTWPSIKTTTTSQRNERSKPMKHKLITIIMALAAIGVALATQANAANITFNFLENGTNIDLGPSSTFTESGISLTASGFLTAGGATDLFAKNGGPVDIGLGINNESAHEINNSTFIQLTLPTVPPSTFNMVVAASVQSGSNAKVYFTTTPGTLAGATLLGTITTNFGSVSIPAGDQTGFIDMTEGLAGSTADVLLNSVTVTVVPESGTVAFLALGAGMLLTLRRRFSGALLPR